MSRGTRKAHNLISPLGISVSIQNPSPHPEVGESEGQHVEPGNVRLLPPGFSAGYTGAWERAGPGRRMHTVLPCS